MPVGDIAPPLSQCRREDKGDGFHRFFSAGAEEVKGKTTTTPVRGVATICLGPATEDSYPVAKCRSFLGALGNGFGNEPAPANGHS
jgi:hypothetical protein